MTKPNNTSNGGTIDMSRKPSESHKKTSISANINATTNYVNIQCFEDPFAEPEAIKLKVTTNHVDHLEGFTEFGDTLNALAILMGYGKLERSSAIMEKRKNTFSRNYYYCKDI